MKTKLPDAFQAAGWNPLEPSDECRRAVGDLLIFGPLSPEDQRGAHYYLVALDLLRRFHRELQRETTDEDMRAVETAATLFAMKFGGCAVTRESYLRERERLSPWINIRLREADWRVEAMIRTGISAEEVSPALARLLEPAFSLRMKLASLNWTDFDGDFAAMEAALHGIERAGVLPSQAKGIPATPVGLDEVQWFLDKALERKPDQKLFHVTDKLQFRLGISETRDTMEALAGAVQPVRERYGRPDADGHVREVAPLDDADNLSDSTAAEASRPVDDADAAEAVRAFLEYRAAKEEAGSADWVAATSFNDMAQGTVTVPELARRHGVSERTLQRSFERLREDLRLALAS